MTEDWLTLLRRVVRENVIVAEGSTLETDRDIGWAVEAALIYITAQDRMRFLENHGLRRRLAVLLPICKCGHHRVEHSGYMDVRPDAHLPCTVREPVTCICPEFDPTFAAPSLETP